MKTIAAAWCYSVGCQRIGEVVSISVLVRRNVLGEADGVVKSRDLWAAESDTMDTMP